MTKTISKKRSKKLSATRGTTSPRFVLLGLSSAWSNRFAKQESVECRSLAEMSEAASRANKDSLWIASRSGMIDKFIRAMGQWGVTQPGRGTQLGNLLMLDAPRAKTLQILQGYFQSVVGADSSFKSLPTEQLAELLSAPREQARDVFIGGLVDITSETLVLVRGDLSRIVVPLSLFRASGASTPEFHRFEVDDYGQTIRFGRYEAGADFVLYALDLDFRKRANSKRRQLEQGFGPSLRRLRTLRKVGRDAFDGIAAKTIARIERGEVLEPRGKTLQVICKVLEVEADEIETY